MSVYVLLVTVWLVPDQPTVSAWPMASAVECRELDIRMSNTLRELGDPFDARCVWVQPINQRWSE